MTEDAIFYNVEKESQMQSCYTLILLPLLDILYQSI